MSLWVNACRLVSLLLPQQRKLPMFYENEVNRWGLFDEDNAGETQLWERKQSRRKSRDPSHSAAVAVLCNGVGLSYVRDHNMGIMGGISSSFPKMTG